MREFPDSSSGRFVFLGTGLRREALQTVLSRTEVAGKSHGCTVFAGCGRSVALFLKKFAEQIVSFEDGSFLHRCSGREVAAGEAHGQGIIVSSAKQHVGA